MHALIIEDNFLIATLIEDILRGLGYTSFDFAEREADAIRAAERRCPDLITADQRLTDGSGVDAVRAICAGRAIPAVFISDYQEDVRRLAPDAILIGKPFNDRMLSEAVARAIAAPMQAGQPAG
ncbi:MAG TPA: response regulator [Allosphingosinicella sp.]|nr:response regulator [Allosphingosinicella sp.]